MAKIKHIIRYFALNYPYKSELSKARLTKMVYLADLFSVERLKGKQMTNIDWFFDHYGPYVTDVYEEAKKDKTLEIQKEFTAFGTPKRTIYLKEENIQNLKLNKLTEDERRILDFVIDETKYLNWSEFIDYVYNTQPIRSQERYSWLKLDGVSR